MNIRIDPTWIEQMIGNILFTKDGRQYIIAGIRSIEDRPLENELYLYPIEVAHKIQPERIH